ncbi:MAG TPA: SDR family NAD(P)-dependent oxidoreductase, partial [Polyangiales bacterium]|nr:SDR family NAD(P)-dependent oxidoreductase [Polyangiales bacterium]
LLPELREQLASIAPRAGQVPLYSTVEARVLSGEELDADYWCRNLRETVRLDLALSQLLAAGHGVFVELSAHPVLTLSLSGACDDHGAMVVGSLQREAGGFAQLLRALTALYVQGLSVDWKPVFASLGGRKLALPTYAFQRERFWVDTTPSRKDAQALGLASANHPLLGAFTALADSAGYVFSGLLSLHEQRWLKDHSMEGAVVMPGTGLLELALQAARAVGLQAVVELTLEQPLVLDEAALQLQVSVGALDDDGCRSVSIYSRVGDGDFQRHALGRVGAGQPLEQEHDFVSLREWPVDAEPVPFEHLYERVLAKGLAYGEAFRGLRELRRSGSRVYARVSLPEGVRKQAERYAIHPALLDAALHALAATVGEEQDVVLPFVWSEATLYAAGASELRVCLELLAGTSEERAATLWLADGSGEPVARIAGLQLRPLRAAQLRAAQRSTVENLYRVELQPVVLAPSAATEQVVLGGDGQLARQLAAAWSADLESYLLQLGAAEAAPRIVVDARNAEQGTAEHVLQQAQAASCHMLELLQRVLAEPRLSATELVWVTASAVDGGDGDVLDLVHAPLWGMLRAARNEHPERSLRLLDLGSEAPDSQFLEQALSATREPELVLRRNDAEWQARAPRLVRVLSSEQGGFPQLTGKVLITGGTGELGRALAEQLVATHGVKQLVLASRQGPAATGAQALVEQLRAAGAERVELRACDVTEGASLTALVQELGVTLCAVFHLSGVLEDGPVEAQSAERLGRVFAPKALGALLLDELTRDRELQAFVLYSSASGTLGGVGQSNYAAANALVDALAAQRRQRGLPGTSIAWGLWQPSGTGLTAALKDADLARLGRSGIAPLTAAEGARLIDASLRSDRAHVVAIRLELSALQRDAAQGAQVPALMRSLVRPGLRRAAADAVAAQASALRERLSQLAEGERVQALLELVCGEVATVLGLSSPHAVDPNKELAKLGLDSLMAVELRNRLAAVAGTALPATLAFDYPTPHAIAQLLLQQGFGALGSRRQARKTQRLGSDEPIAIIGMSCRLPGGIDTPEGYWELLERGGDAIEGFPERWSELDVYDADPDAAGKTYAREGGFVHGVD